jgi:glucokinase
LTKQVASPAEVSGPVAIAIDIGGTKIAGSVVAADGTHSAPAVRPTGHPAAAVVEEILTDLTRTVTGPVIGVGFSSAGPLDPADGSVSPVNIPSLHRYPLAARTAATLRGLGLPAGTPVRLAGDGICAAIGEHWQGAGQGVRDGLFIVVSTGIGGGLIQGGVAVAGRTGNAGHIGHMIVEADGELCACGAAGCLEAYASGPSMVRWAVRQGWQSLGRTAVELAQSARDGDPVAEEAFARGGLALAAGIASTAALADIDHVIIGGGVANAHDVLFPPVLAGLERLAQLDFTRTIVVAPGELGGSAGVLGAAAGLHQPARYGGASLIRAQV